MNRRLNMKRNWWILAALALFALSATMIAAAPSSPDAPVALYNEEAVRGTLTGNRGGAFAYYRVDYPGDQSVVTIELQYVPADPVTTAGVGFNVYGSNGFFIGQGQVVTDTGGSGIFQLPYSDNNKATWLVQVYNYIPNHSISYSISAEGLPAQEAPAVPTAVPVVATPAPVTTTGLQGAGNLTGNHGGAFAVYKVDLVAGAHDVKVTLNWSPDDGNIAKGVGFVVYGPSGKVAQGAPTGTPGERTTTLSPSVTGVYQVQIYNYIDGLPIHYMLKGVPVAE
jgi:hypothetical protein